MRCALLLATSIKSTQLQVLEFFSVLILLRSGPRLEGPERSSEGVEVLQYVYIYFDSAISLLPELRRSESTPLPLRVDTKRRLTRLLSKYLYLQQQLLQQSPALPTRLELPMLTLSSSRKHVARCPSNEQRAMRFPCASHRPYTSRKLLLDVFCSCRKRAGSPAVAAVVPSLDASFLLFRDARLPRTLLPCEAVSLFALSRSFSLVPVASLPATGTTIYTLPFRRLALFSSSSFLSSHPQYRLIDPIHTCYTVPL